MNNLTFNQVSKENLSNAFLEVNQGQEKPLEQIISIVDNLFLLLDDQQELPDHIKGIIFHLYKSYEVNKIILESQNPLKYDSQL